jgi:hypothetical protein
MSEEGMTATTMPKVGQVLKAVSGTRPISVEVVAVDESRIRLRCGPDWTWQNGLEFDVETRVFPQTVFGRGIA